MSVALLIIGDEVKLGEVADKNGPYLSRALGHMGIEVGKVVIVGDHDIKPALEALIEEFDYIFTTGGLGPTHDDITLETISRVCNLDLEKDGEQIPNRVGSAPGVIAKTEKATIISFPGVPAEMREMTDLIVERLFSEKKSGRFSQTVRFCHLNENRIAPMLPELEKKHPGIRLGVYPGRSILRVSIRGEARDAEIFGNESKEIRTELESAFPTNVYPDEKGSIEKAVHEILVERRETIALAESCTGGILATKLTKSPGSSAFFIGSMVVYSDGAKEAILDVSKETLDTHGAVSGEVVQEMIEGLFSKTDADWAIAISGVAGPDGGTDEKPVGTVWASIVRRGEPIVTGKIPFVRVYPRDVITERSANWILGALYRKIAYGIEPFSEGLL